MLSVLLWIISLNLTVSPSASELCKHGGMQKLYHVQIPQLSPPGAELVLCTTSVWRHVSLTSRSWCAADLKSTASEGVTFICLPVKYGEDNSVEDKLLVPWLAIPVCHDAKWITDTPQTKVGKSLNGALNSPQSRTGAAVNTWKWLNQHDQLSCSFPRHRNSSAERCRVKETWE